uniref:Dehydration-responsive element-binding protein 1F n=2 Tax=Cajanus cajan TaxID=3821 RepID=A0A151U3A5_CAJCA|nr:Dehydration-responsive element-binding protein 1F [Cajanus cajan]
MAALAYDVAALAFKGDSASLNFPHAATSLPRLNSRTSSVRAIQNAATQAAESHFLMPTEVSSQEASGSFFWDEEEVFNLPELLNSMAEALIMTPPALQNGFNWVAGESETTVDLTLWGN